MIDTLLFDLDGTLRDWEAGIARALAELMSEAPEMLPEELRGDLDTRIWRAIDEQLIERRDGRIVERRHYWIDIDPMPVWRAVLPDVPQRPLDALIARFRELLDAVPFADVYPALEQLREHYALGVLTNGPMPESVLRRMGFAHYFDDVVTVFGGIKKPASAAFERGLDALEAERATTAYVGDSLIADVQGALSAGLTAVWIDRFGDGNPLPEGAYRIEALTELPALLVALAEGAA